MESREVLCTVVKERHWVTENRNNTGVHGCRIGQGNTGSGVIHAYRCGKGVNVYRITTVYRSSTGL
jgi:hypothetical protein